MAVSLAERTAIPSTSATAAIKADSSRLSGVTRVTSGKLVNSALANAQNNDPGVDVDALYVSRACVDEAPVLKRSRHVAMGRVFPIIKRACHVTIDLDVAGQKSTTEAEA